MKHYLDEVPNVLSFPSYIIVSTFQWTISFRHIFPRMKKRKREPGCWVMLSPGPYYYSHCSAWRCPPSRHWRGSRGSSSSPPPAPPSRGWHLTSTSQLSEIFHHHGLCLGFTPCHEVWYVMYVSQIFIIFIYIYSCSFVFRNPDYVKKYLSSEYRPIPFEIN